MIIAIELLPLMAVSVVSMVFLIIIISEKKAEKEAKGD